MMRASHDKVADMWIEQLPNVVLMEGVSWKTYLLLDRDRGGHKWPRLAYLDGNLEIMTHSEVHELRKKILAQLLEAYVRTLGQELNGFGNTTWRDAADEAGLEADECYFVGRRRGRERPHLAIEVTFTSGGVNKLEIYRRLGVGEVWFWQTDEIHIYTLGKRGYTRRLGSRLFPYLDVLDLAERVCTADPFVQSSAIRAYERSLKRSK